MPRLGEHHDYCFKNLESRIRVLQHCILIKNLSCFVRDTERITMIGKGLKGRFLNSLLYLSWRDCQSVISNNPLLNVQFTTVLNNLENIFVLLTLTGLILIIASHCLCRRNSRKSLNVEKPQLKIMNLNMNIFFIPWSDKAFMSIVVNRSSLLYRTERVTWNYYYSPFNKDTPNNPLNISLEIKWHKAP